MSEQVKRPAVAWEPLAAAACFVSAVVALAVGFVFTTRWLLDEHLHPLLHGVGLLLLVLGLPIMILGGHFMDLRDKKRKQQSHYSDPQDNNGNKAVHVFVVLLALLSILSIHGGNVRAQASESPSAEQPAPQSNSEWQYGGFIDVAYPLDFNHPGNHLFRRKADRSSFWRKRNMDSVDASWGLTKLTSFHLRRRHACQELITTVEKCVRAPLMRLKNT